MRAMDPGNQRRDMRNIRHGIGPAHADGDRPTGPSAKPPGGATHAVPDRTRLAMELVYGESFDQVQLRVSDSETAALGGLSARAVTYGDTIWMRQGDYRPDSLQTEGILAHELAHVLQQRTAGSAGPDSLEREADQAAALSLAPTGAQGRVPRLRGGLQLQRCSASDVPGNLAQLDAAGKAAVIRRVIQEDHYNKNAVVYTVFQSAAEHGQFVATQEQLDMADVLSDVDTWTAVRIGTLGPVIKGVDVLTDKRADLIYDMTHDYGLAYAQVFTALIVDTTQDDQVIAVLRELASRRRLDDTIGSMPAIKDRLTQRDINLGDYPDRSFRARDLGRGAWTAISDFFGSSRGAQENRGSSLRGRISDLPEPYQKASEEIDKKVLEEAFSPRNVALGAFDEMTFGVPVGAYRLVTGTITAFREFGSGKYEQGVRDLVPALITVGTLMAGRALGAPGAGEEPPPSSGAPPRAGGGIVSVRVSASGVLTLDQVMASWPEALRSAALSLKSAFTSPELQRAAGYVRRSAPAAAIVEEAGVPGVRSLLDSGGNVPKARAMLPALVAVASAPGPVKTGTAPAAMAARPMPTAAEMEKAATEAKDEADLQRIVLEQVKNRKGQYKGPLPIYWPYLGGHALAIDAPSTTNSIKIGRSLTRVKPSPRRDRTVVEDFMKTNTVLKGQAVHHVTPLMMGGPDSVDNLAAVWISYHEAGHSLLRAQHQLPPLGYSHDPQEHANNTPYVVVLII